MSTEVKKITAPDFIEKHLLPGIKSMIQQGFDYLAFPLIAQTIELIGGFFDSTPFDEDEKSRFQNGIKHLFKNDVYKNNQTKFYEDLRCSFAHQMRPGEGFLLTSLASGTPKEMHLQKSDAGHRYLVVDCFYQDLEQAVKRLLNEIKKDVNSVNQKKVDQVFLVVQEVKVFSGGSSASATVSSFPQPEHFSTHTPAQPFTFSVESSKTDQTWCPPSS